MREASNRRTVTDTDSYAFILQNNILTANERMTEAQKHTSLHEAITAPAPYGYTLRPRAFCC